MKDIIKHISFVVALCVFLSCSLREDFDLQGNQNSVEFVARLTGFNNVDITTKSAPTEEFETAVYTAYFLLFDSSTGARIAVDSVDVSSGSLSQTIVGKMPGLVTACFIANVSQEFINGLTTIDALNSAVLDITYATYSEAGGYLGVPKLTVNGETKLCIPMFGSKNISNITNGENIEIPVKRLFAKVTMNIKMQLTNVGIGQIAPTTVNYELIQYQLYSLPTKVRLRECECECEGQCVCESGWVSDKSAFYGNATTPLSSNSNLGLQTINISDSDDNTDNDSSVVGGIEFSFYVPEYYLLPKTGATQDQKSKPQNFDGTKCPVYVKLIGEVNQSLIDNTRIEHNIYLGGNAIDDFTLVRNKNYINQLTIKGIENNDKGTGDNLDHRVSTDIINNPVAQAGKAANCYIIAKPGEYTIPAYKGAYNNLNGATLCMSGKNLSEYETRVEVLANVVEYEGISSITFSAPPTYDPETNTISFTVDPMLNNKNWVPNGSVILALQYRKKGETTWITEWSWHLWFVYNITAAEDGWGTIGSQTMPDGTTKMMDRNLGVHAFTNAGRESGFYYRYGEHAPYLDPDGDGVYTQYGGGSIGNSAPTWSASGKSVTDPCPPGYKVPLADVWTDLGSHNLGGYYEYASSIYYPYYKNSNGDNLTESHTYDYLVKNEYNLNVLGTKKAKNIKYIFTKESNYGVLSTTDSGSYIQYFGVNMSLSELLNFTPTSCEVGERENKGTWRDPVYVWTWETRELSRSELATLKTAMTLSGNTMLGDIKFDYSAAQGNYQVRCVKEEVEEVTQE